MHHSTYGPGAWSSLTVAVGPSELRMCGDSTGLVTSYPLLYLSDFPRWRFLQLRRVVC